VLAGGDQPFLGMYDSGGINRVDVGFYSNGAQGVQFNNSVGSLIWASP
jgi:hypothetical protein